MKTKIAFLTGQSNPRSTALSPLQTEFMKSIPVSEDIKSYRNFPYNEGETFSEVNIMKASFSNAKQYLTADRNSEIYSVLFDSYFNENDSIILLAGSCGLHLFNCLNLPDDMMNKICIFAYGPTAHRIPNCRETYIVQGREDWISRLWKLPVDEYTECGHMDYLNQRSVYDSFIQFLQRLGILI